MNWKPKSERVGQEQTIRVFAIVPITAFKPQEFHDGKGITIRVRNEKETRWLEWCTVKFRLGAVGWRPYRFVNESKGRRLI